MSIVNTCYTKQLQELEFAEKLNKQEVDRMYEAYMNCLNQNKNINSKILILQKQNKKEVFSIKYLPMFPKEVNDRIRNSMKQINYIRLRNFVLEFSLIRLEQKYSNMLGDDLISLFISSINSFEKNRKPILINNRYLGRLREYANKFNEILDLKTKEEKKQFLCGERLFSCRCGFTPTIMKEILNVEDQMDRFTIENYVEELYNILVEIDYNFVNEILEKIKKFSLNIRFILRTVENNWRAGVEDYYDEQRTSQYELLCNYKSNQVIFNKLLNENYITREVYDKLLTNKPITLCNKTGAMNKRKNREIVYWDLVIFLYYQFTRYYKDDIKYFYFNDLIFADKDIDKNMRLFNFIKTDCNWFVKNVLVDFELFNLEDFVNTNRNYYTTIVRDRKEIYNYDSDMDDYYEKKDKCRYIDLELLVDFRNYRVRRYGERLEEIKNGLCKNDKIDYDMNEYGEYLNNIVSYTIRKSPF